MSAQNPESSRRDLILRSKQGDEVALGELLEEHRDWLKKMAVEGLNGQVSRRIDASDIVQQTLLSACNRIRQFSGATSGQFNRWLKRIHERNIQDALRRHVGAHKRSTNHETFFPVSEFVAHRDAATPSHHAIRKERAARLLQFLETLPEDQANAVRLRHFEGWSLAQMADHFGRSTDSVASLLKRGVENLRQRIRED